MLEQMMKDKVKCGNFKCYNHCVNCNYFNCEYLTHEERVYIYHKEEADSDMP